MRFEMQIIVQIWDHTLFIKKNNEVANFMSFSYAINMQIHLTIPKYCKRISEAPLSLVCAFISHWGCYARLTIVLYLFIHPSVNPSHLFGVDDVSKSNRFLESLKHIIYMMCMISVFWFCVLCLSDKHLSAYIYIYGL